MMFMYFPPEIIVIPYRFLLEVRHKSPRNFAPVFVVAPLHRGPAVAAFRLPVGMAFVHS